jgi:hypothetical protein
MVQKQTMKEQVLRFVEQRGSASYTEIQRFIVDTKFGAGTYGSQMVIDYVWIKDYPPHYEKRLVRKNPYRGYYSAAFSGGRLSKTTKQWIPGGYFLRSNNRLVKQPDGKYSVVCEPKDRKKIN